LFKLVYYKTGSTKESSFVSKWDSGWKDFENGNWKKIERIRVFYEGTSGTLNFRYYNQDGNDDNFDIDLSIDEGDDSYSIVEDEKVYTHYVEANEVGENPIGRLWRFVVSENGTVPWKISKIEIKFSVEPEID
jgi:hypothetical protein